MRVFDEYTGEGRDIPTIPMRNDGPHDSMNEPVSEVPVHTPLIYEHNQQTGATKVVFQTPVKAVQDERCSVYGEAQFNIGGNAQAITGYLENKWQMKLPTPITEHDVCMFNVLAKVSRMAQSPGHADSLLDAHSYLDLAEKAAQRGLNELSQLGQEMQPNHFAVSSRPASKPTTTNA